ncbi:uncharacterized protein C8orf34-like isoform X1 [Oculina patagonica]
MAKVIKDTPDDPIAYLIKVLKRLYSEGGAKGAGSSLPPSGSKVSFGRSMGLTGTSVARHSFDEGRSVLAKSWACPDSHTEGSKYRPSSASKVAGRDYPRPWLSGSKPAKSSEAMDRDNMRPPARKGQAYSDNEKPPWNHKTAVQSHDFDEWFSMQHRATRTADEDSRDFPGSSSWGRNGEMEMPAEREVIYNRRAPSAGPMHYADDSLEAELNMGRDIKTREEENDSSSMLSYESNRSRKQKARHAAEEHRRQLQALLMNKSHSRRDVNGIGDSEDLHDDGTELLENVDELESEGVSNLNSSGARLSKSIKQGTATSESIRVSICARCAKIITGQPSDRKSEAGSVYSASEVDDNFDSVSQVGSTTGLSRPPVWPSGFDSESDSSPRKGQHMWQSPSRSPVKGKHMFRGGSFTSDHPDSSRPPTASSSRSDLVYSGRQQKSWNYGGYSSDNDTDVNYDRAGSPELGGSRPWNRAPVESGSEADWDTRRGNTLLTSFEKTVIAAKLFQGLKFSIFVKAKGVKGILVDNMN